MRRCIGFLKMVGMMLGEVLYLYGFWGLAFALLGGIIYLIYRSRLHHAGEGSELVTHLERLVEDQVEAKNQELEVRVEKLILERSLLRTQLRDIRKGRDLQLEKEGEVFDRERLVAQRAEEVGVLREDYLERLERLSGVSRAEALEALSEQLRIKAEASAGRYVRQAMEEARLGASKEAKRLVMESIQRCVVEHTAECCVSVVHLENDQVKGKIIGREGRNIRAIEQATGVQVLIDDTPNTLVVSCFDAFRRETARLAIGHLLQDGRIHPVHIEEVVEKVRGELEEKMEALGQRAVVDLDLHDLHPSLVSLVGRMQYRYSYGQNLLSHSKEVARLSACMAAEMGLSVVQAKRAGLLHDIGKVHTNVDLSHALSGMELARKYNEVEEVCNAIGAHHNEIEMVSLISHVVQICDAISGSRLGARRENIELYIKRLHEMEAIAMNYSGVHKCYAMQAGRILRVIVNATVVDDHSMDELADQISEEIQDKMQYPGQVKVVVIREKRVISYAK